MAQQTTTKILERCQISPPSGSVPPVNLPLTFFDVVNLHIIPMQRIFFFDFPLTIDHFTLTIVPELKHSLSLALRHFFPFAADLVLPAPPHKPHLLFSDDSFVSFTVAESTADFDHLLSDDPRDVTDYHPFVPTLPMPSVLAVQVTVFPNSGVAVGVTFNHVAADGKAFSHFVRSWAFLFRTISTSQDLPSADPCKKLDSLPSHDRDGILDPHGLQLIFLKEYWAGAPDFLEDTGHGPKNKVRANFVMGRAHITKIKQSVSAHFHSKEEPLPRHFSTFVVTIAYTWVQLMKSLLDANELTRDGDETYHLCFVGDCRNRPGFKSSIPDTYFGNCLAVCYVSLKRSDLVGENGIFRAAKVIGERIKEFRKEPLRGADKWMSFAKEVAERGDYLVVVAGSQYLRMYDTDFGWGKPRKTLTVHDHTFPSIALSECRGEDGGIEVRLALDKDKMNTFSVLFERDLMLL